MTGLDIRVGHHYFRPIGDGVRRVIEIVNVGGRHVNAAGWIEDSTTDGWVVRPKTQRRSRITISTTFRVLYRRLEES